MRLNRTEISSVCTKMDTHSSVFYSCESLNLIKYQAKPTKTVVVLSKELHARQRERKSQGPFSITMRTNVEWTCLTQCVDRCQRCLAAGDDHLLSSSTFWTSPVSTCGHYSERRQVHACHGVSCQHNWQKHQSRNQTANSSICIIVFNNGSFWEKVQLSSEMCLQAQQNHHSVTYVCRRPVCGKCMENICKQCQAQWATATCIIEVTCCTASIDALGCSSVKYK